MHLQNEFSYFLGHYPLRQKVYGIATGKRTLYNTLDVCETNEGSDRTSPPVSCFLRS